jgi:hypothetical protein
MPGPTHRRIVFGATAKRAKRAYFISPLGNFRVLSIARKSRAGIVIQALKIEDM